MHQIAPEVECFGHVIFEMAFGRPKPTLKETEVGEPVPLLPPCDPLVYSLLESIFEPQIECGYATLESISKHPLFAPNLGSIPPKPSLSFSSKVTRLLGQMEQSSRSLMCDILATKKIQNKRALLELAETMNSNKRHRRVRGFSCATKSVPIPSNTQTMELGVESYSTSLNS